MTARLPLPLGLLPRLTHAGTTLTREIGVLDEYGEHRPIHIPDERVVRALSETNPGIRNAIHGDIPIAGNYVREDQPIRCAVPVVQGHVAIQGQGARIGCAGVLRRHLDGGARLHDGKCVEDVLQCDVLSDEVLYRDLS